MLHTGILGPQSSSESRVFHDYEKAAAIVNALRQLGQKIVLTSGTWDMLHVDHCRYLANARTFGDVLVVGVDSDAKVREGGKKGPYRPFVPEDERAEMLTHLRHVDMVVMKPAGGESNGLIKIIHPDVLIVSETSGHDDGDIERKREFCGKVEFVPSMKSTSTTAKLRTLIRNGLEEFSTELSRQVPVIMQNILERMAEKKQEKDRRPEVAS